MSLSHTPSSDLLFDAWQYATYRDHKYSQFTRPCIVTKKCKVGSKFVYVLVPYWNGVNEVYEALYDFAYEKMSVELVNPIKNEDNDGDDIKFDFADKAKSYYKHNKADF